MSAAKADEENVCVVPLLLLELLEVLRGAFGDRSFLQLGTIAAHGDEVHCKSRRSAQWL